MNSIYDSSQRGDSGRIRAFLASSKGIDDPNPVNGMNLLHYACHGEQQEVVQILCSDHRMQLNAQDEDGWTALHFASDRGHMGIVSDLIRRGADGTKVDKFQKTALHYAAGNGHFKVTQLLLTSFPETAYIKSRADKKPYDLALINKQQKVLEIFDLL